MGSERRILIYDRYYRDQESEFQNTSGNRIDIAQPETLMHRGYRANNPGASNPQRYHSFDFRPEDRSFGSNNINRNHQDYGNLINNPMQQPAHSIEFGQHQQFGYQASHIGAGTSQYPENSGHNFSSNSDLRYGDVETMGNSMTYHHPSHQHGYHAMHGGTEANDRHPRTGESNSRLNSEYQRYGVLLGTSTSHRVADHSIEFGPHQQGSHQASRVYTGVIDYPQNCGPSFKLSNDQGYLNSEGVSHQNVRLGTNTQSFRGNQCGNFVSTGHATVSCNTSTEVLSIPVHENINPSNQRDKSKDVNFPSYKNDQTLPDISQDTRKSDETTSLERSKLISRIARYYEVNAPATFSKNRDKFEIQDWVRVYYTCYEGLKIYLAEMNCPLCFGHVKPQNKNKKPGMLPSWDLTPVVRHIASFHEENEDGTGRKRGRSTPKHAVQLSKKKRETENEKDEHSNETLVKPANEKHSEEVAETSVPSEEVSCHSAKLETSEIPLNENTNGKVEPGDPDRSSPSPSGLTESSSSSGSSSSSSSDSTSDSSSDSISSSDSSLEEIDIKKRKKRCKKKKTPGNGKHRKRGDKRPSTRKSCKAVPEAKDNSIDWTKPGVFFGWIKLKKKSDSFLPAFIFPKEKGKQKHEAQYIEVTGDLSKKQPVEVIANAKEIERVMKSKKSASSLKAVQLFNSKNKTKF